MTDNEIIKALECHARRTESNLNCCDCGYIQHQDCSQRMSCDALSLINRQKTEIENLKDLVKRIRRNALMIRNINCETAKKIKSETVKEFAKFCIDKSKDGVISVCEIADYAIEMVDEW